MGYRRNSIGKSDCQGCRGNNAISEHIILFPLFFPYFSPPPFSPSFFFFFPRTVFSMRSVLVIHYTTIYTQLHARGAPPGIRYFSKTLLPRRRRRRILSVR